MADSPQMSARMVCALRLTEAVDPVDRGPFMRLDVPAPGKG